jgi:hypothetical protein
MKNTILPLCLTGLLGQASIAGSVITEPIAAPDAGFGAARRPITNPTLFDLALPGTNLHPIFLYQRLPNTINTQVSPNTPLGGDVQLYALQFEIALNERLSIIATKDGYVDSNPDNTLNDTNGFANLGGGLKYAFILDPASGTAVSGTATVELPTGNSDVFQGEGDGAVNLIVNGLKLHDAWQFAGSLGFQLPFSGEQSTSSFVSAHVSHAVCDWFIPLVEVNWFHVLDAGNGTGNYPDHLGGNLPAVLNFEGGDLFNFGSVNAGANRDLVTAAVGFRSRLTDSVDLGVAYEIPLTDSNDSVMKDRFTLDLVWKS